MKVAQSRITAQGQVSVPAEVRKHLGLAPGSTIDWEMEGDAIVVRRSGRFTFNDVRVALFPEGPPDTKSTGDLKQGIRAHMRRRARP